MRKALILSLFVFSACNADFKADLAVQTDKTPLMAEPDAQSREIGKLSRGEHVRDLEDVAPVEVIVKQGNLSQTALWVKVSTRRGKEGWVLSYLLHPIKGVYGEWLGYKRLQARCGKELARESRALAYPTTVETDEAFFADRLRRVSAFRDTLQTALRNAPYRENPDEEYEWLPKVLPEFLIVQVTGSTPSLFLNYSLIKDLFTPAIKGNSDDEFVQFMTEIYPPDGIESPFPAWKFQLDENSSASRLGEGRHTEILEKLKSLWNRAQLFQPELRAVKNSLLADICDVSVSYWQSDEKILTELNLIIKNDYFFLDERDRLSLSQRLKMFENAAANGIWTNRRSGREQPE